MVVGVTEKQIADLAGLDHWGKAAFQEGLDAAFQEAGDEPSVHAVFQLYQEGGVSTKQFITALGGEIPDAARKLLETDPQLTFPKFIKAFGKVNSFASFRAGGKTKYKDSVGSILSDNSGPSQPSKPGVPVEYRNDAAFRRVRSDINAPERDKLKNNMFMKSLGTNLPIRKRNELSANNPMLCEESIGVAADAEGGRRAAQKPVAGPETNRASEAEELMQSAVRMLLSGELGKWEFVDYVSELKKDDKVVAKAAEVLAERHEVNGPYSFKYMMEQVRKIVPL